MDVEASPEVGAASEASPFTPAVATAAPQGWSKKVVPRKGGSPIPRDVVFVAPTGEELRSKQQLRRYLKANPGGPPLSDFDWSTGETPRRSERLSTKTRKSVDSPKAAPPAKRAKKKTQEKKPEEDEEVTEDKDDEMPDISNLFGEATPTIEPEESKALDAETLAGNETGSTDINQHFEVPAPESHFEDKETERKDFEEAVPIEELKEEKEIEIKTVEEPSPVKDLKEEEKEIEIKTVEEPSPWKDLKDDEIKDNELPKQGLDDDSKKEENVESVETEKESNLFETTEEEADTEMQDPAPVTDEFYEEVVIKEEVTVIVESTEELIDADKDVSRLEKNVESELPTSENAASENLESGENKKDAIEDGKQDATNADFTALGVPGQDEHVEEIRTESDHAKTGIASYLNASKPQEAHPAEVGVSS